MKLSSCALVVLLSSNAIALVDAQQNTTNPHLEPLLTMRNAANSWQADPKTLSQQVDTTTPDQRSKRNSLWDRRLTLYKGLAPGESVGEANSPTTYGPQRELPNPPGSLWAIVTFEDHHVFLTSVIDPLVYTELNLRIDSILRGNAPVHVGQLIDVGIPGGRVRLPDGSIKSTALTPLRWSWRPRHRYLAVLEPNDDGSFHEYARWDVTDGTVEADTAVEARRQKSAPSVLQGIPVDTLPDILHKNLTEAR